MRVPLAMGREGHLFALAFGIPQFVLNFNFVYAAEQYITSGIVAVVFALLLVPNSVLSWLFLKHRVTGRFLLGSTVAMAGVALLFVNEMQHSPASPRQVAIGIGLTLLGVLAASVSNVMQASARFRAYPVVALLSWGMFYGTLGNLVVALVMSGGPVFEDRLGYWVGLLYLGVFASAVTFTLYLRIIRAVGPGRAAYSSLLIPIIAMALSSIFEDYRWSRLAVIGCLLALLGLYIALRSAKSPVPSETTA
jgi:drug/metabolite transporter (DMT)-like permease